MTIRQVLGLAENVNLKAHRTYRIWYGMRQRVYYKKHHAYALYQALGVTVCDRWLGKTGFLSFLEDMGHPPTDKHSLERIDNNGMYSPENCKWGTPAEQSRNRSSCRYFDTPVGRICLSEAAKYYGLTLATVYGRVYSGMTDPVLIFSPRKKRDKRSSK